MKLKSITARLNNDPGLAKSGSYVVLTLDGASPETAFLMGVYKVEGDIASPLRYDCDAEPEPDELSGPEGALDEDDLDDAMADSQKPLRPEAVIYDHDSSLLLTYHLNRTEDGLVGLSDDQRHTLPLVFCNIGEKMIKVDGEKVISHGYLVHTAETPSRAKRKADIEASMSALLSRPDVAAEIEAVRQSVSQKLRRNV